MEIAENNIVNRVALSDDQVVQAIMTTQDQKLIRKSQLVIYQRYADKVYRKCLTLVRKPDCAEDLTHDIFIKVYINLVNYRSEALFYSWLFAITYNHCFNFLKIKKRIQLEDLYSFEDNCSIEEIEKERKELEEIQYRQLETLLVKIPDNERIILLMRYWDDMSIKEISGILNLKESAVKMRIKRGRDHLSELLKSTKS